MPNEINRAYDSVSDPEAPQKRQEQLDDSIKKFLANGGKIEKIPTGMTGEEYKEYKKGNGKKKKASKRK
tara:strand:- start:170 stop:376 length:207 start_codon:yes stop_codon:yes gene_type:complete